ncbi:MAG: 50S ribosomal protein L24 [Thermoplasmata archaeon]
MAHQSSSAPRRQRKALYTADSFHRRRRMSVPLSRELRARFHCRSVPVRKGDTVRILSGSYVGSEERVAKVDRRSYSVILNNITLKTGEQKQKPLPIRTGQLLLTKLNLSDAWRRRILSVREEELTPEELGTVPEAPAAAAEGGAAAAPPAHALPEPEEDMHLTEAEREFLADAGTEEEAPARKTPEKGAPGAPSEGSGRGEMKLTPKETAFFESAEKEEYGPNAKAVRTHKKAPKDEEEREIAGESPGDAASSEEKPRAPAKTRSKSRPPKEGDDA